MADDPSSSDEEDPLEELPDDLEDLPDEDESMQSVQGLNQMG